ncbi:SusD/RagB family nutrient-binding outer membrane lipoprotein [Chitinophaga rhizophila]|uniref:SusD/RagB family nutrient-binding outer membrane lipoprotein n=1 Tax=Chitinophaga rhizophila TaxID=2866212 RepID=A0ABS7G8S6_9BACT|nr:SusD/RagB family nutrient-binding outer membrane lipoprotein [Chitinophaga rhizophila]MBW8684049.1 SusD/RagB family nutrient-binding outer membrane lipoprotein [Chitinophaga rhizophila]
MKAIIKSACLVLTGSLLLQSCSKFEEINNDPNSASEGQVEVEYAINGSITGAQMNPDVAERSFVLYWKTAGRQHRQGGLSSGGYDDGWTSAYYNQVSGWLNGINLAIELAEKRMADNSAKPHTKNLLQVARIWRAYLLSEASDNFGPLPIEAFQSKNPEFNSVKEVYYYILKELTEAVAAIDESVANPDGLSNFDPAYGYNYAKWVRYANSLRMRLAMRLSEVDTEKAKTEFEAAVATGKLITEADHIFKVQEKPGWDDLTGVMSREWNAQLLSATLNNLYVGLGGIPSQQQLPDSLHKYIKPADYVGLKFANHMASMTNDPVAGYWFDGLQQTIDPRAYKTFIVPGQFNNPDFSPYPTYTNDAKTVKRNMDGFGEVNASFTWNAATTGDWGEKGAKNFLYTYPGTNPRLAQRFRNSTSQRIFFAPWETYFLMAEAAVRGWATPVSAQNAYETGVSKSFEYWGVTQFLSTYLASQDYNRAGTSVRWTHTTEPGATHAMNYIDAYTKAPGTANILYPSNTLYKNGTVKNDALTKIITQKFIAQVPWLPLEAWSDQRRLGLPFYENPAIERPLPNLPALNAGNYMTSDIRFFPQRLRYPSGLPNSNAEGYQQAVSLLEGADAVLTPLWWAKH